METANIPQHSRMSFPPMSNGITLTVDGVHFNLIPSEGNDTSSTIGFSANTCGEFTTIDLHSFTGSLVICSQNLKQTFPPLNIATMTSEPSVKGNLEVSANTVEDEPHSPVNEPMHQNDIPKGQQQLPFNKKNGTKNKSKASDNELLKKKRLSSEEDVVPPFGQSSQGSSQAHINSNDFNLEHLMNAPIIPSPLVRNSKVEEMVRREEMNPTQSEHRSKFMNEDDYEHDHYQENSPNAIMELDDVTMDIDESNLFLSKNESLSFVDQNAPSPRWGQTMTMINDDRVLVYGGQVYDSAENKLATMTDLYVYDLKKKSWSKPVNCEGMPRAWHSATFLPDRQLLISFGGESFNPKTKKTVTTDQVMVLDTEIMLWYPPSVSGNVPSGRSGHTASLLPNTNELIVFGGVKNNKWQNSMAVLNSMRWSWSVPKVSGTAPKPRSYHSATAVPSIDGNGYNLVIFGGNNETECFNTVHVLDTTKDQWSWYHPNVSGTAPSPRTGHHATLLEDGRTIFIHGGWDPNDDQVNDEDMMFGDSFLLDTSSWTWRSGPNPKFLPGTGLNGGLKRVGASSILALGDDLSQVIIFGGRIPGDKFSNDFQVVTIPQRMMGM